MDTPHPGFPNGPYAVFYAFATPGGGRREGSPSRNLDWASAVRSRDDLRSQPHVVEAHISLDACG